MINQFLFDLANPENKNSLSTKLRSKRFLLFEKLLSSVPFPLKILDVGGRAAIWEQEGFCEPDQLENISITLINVKKSKVTSPNLNAVVGDARNMKQYKDGEFDVVYSNSVIEHVGNYEQQRQMAKEVQRVGQRYFLQTPNRYFPIEPHFLFPFFQFLPLSIQVWLMTRFHIGCRKKVTKQKAIQKVTSIRLLSKKELIELFPNATIVDEKFLGLTKSFILYEGWNSNFQLENL